MRLSVCPVRKIAVLRALYLGDLLCTVPAFRALRYAFPNAQIDLIGLPWSVSFAARFHDYLDQAIIFPGYPGLPEQKPDRLALISFLEKIQRSDYDLILQMHGNGNIVNRLIQAMDAGISAGFYRNSIPDCPNGRFMKYPEACPEVIRHLRLMSFLKIPLQGTFLEFPLNGQDYADLNKLGLDLRPRQYVVLHPGSRSLLRRWPPEYFAALADHCISMGLSVVITGTAEEKTVAKEVLGYMRHEAINLMGLTSLGAVALLIKDAFILLSNCTGVSHIAAAVETPSVIISMDGEPERWSPLNKKLHRVIDWKTKPCFEYVFKQVEMSIEVERQKNKVKLEY